MSKIIIHIDGGSRGNPGQGAVGVVVSDANGKQIKSYSQAIGVCTNNEAEYSALIFALKKIKALLGKDKIKNTAFEIRSDSELLVQQMEGRYKIVEPNLQKLFLEVWNLKVEFPLLKFTAVPREKNKEADRLVNGALDEAFENRPLF